MQVTKYGDIERIDKEIYTIRFPKTNYKQGVDIVNHTNTLQ